MRIERVEATNFGSYPNLVIDFTQEQGLTLLEGPTGAGKSTLCDVVPWILFGRTAKGGQVDEIRTWNNGNPTTGTVVLSLPDGRWEIVRTRGKSNDLTFRSPGLQDVQRGKDLPDTQRLLNQKLGIDFDLYLAGAYYHEFSPTAQFFSTTAKNRRTTCENLVDLSLAVRISDSVKSRRRGLDGRILAAESDLRVQESTLALLRNKGAQQDRLRRDWDDNHVRRTAAAAADFDAFEKNRKRTIGKRCPTCKRDIEECREIFDDSANPHFARVEAVNAEQNPFEGEVKTYEDDIRQADARIRDTQDSLSRLRSESADLDYLDLATSQYRSQSINATISSVEAKTNWFLSEFFDAEIRVLFSAEAADKLEVTIFKDGNAASFTQLSKGQRQLLKFCFGVSVMIAVQNHHGISLNQLFFDEALDGLDDTKKLAAMNMLVTLTQEYASIWLVEHSETVKGMATNKIHVELVNGESQLEKR